MDQQKNAFSIEIKLTARAGKLHSFPWMFTKLFNYVK